MSGRFWRYAPALALGALAATPLERVGLDAFEGATLIDFETAPDPVGSYYESLGVTMVNLFGQRIFDTGTGAGDSWAACNYPGPRPLPAGELRFSTPVRRVGFFVTTQDPDDLTVSAYLGSTLVGSESFDTGGGGAGGSFAGIEFDTPFDRVVIDPADVLTGFFCIDDLRFGAGEAEEAELAVGIDIRPGTTPNPVNTRSNGVIPVAILSSADFDAPAVVDRSTLTFGAEGTEAPVELRGRGTPNCGVEDANRDGRADLVCRFDTRAAGFERGDAEGTLRGRTLEGEPFAGTDAVVVVR